MENLQETEKAAGESNRREGSAGPGEGDREAPEKKRFEIDIFRGWCKSCGICAAFCPRGCIHLEEDGTPTVSDSARCTGCGWCELHCPDFAISVREKEREKPAE